MRLSIKPAVPIALVFILASGPASGSGGTEKEEGVLTRILGAREGDYLDSGGYGMKETLRLSGTRIESPGLSWGARVASRAAEYGWPTPPPPPEARQAGGNIAIAVLASAVLPGMGELYVWSGTRRLSHLLRAPVFLALDAYFWYSYDYNHDRGKEIKAAYERFCDAHWSEERFLQQHPYCDGIGGCDSWQQYNEEARGDYYYFVYIPRHLDHEEYYENCGKYDAFAFGWDDWNGDYDDFEPWTPNRTKYWSMRSESDDYLVKGDQFIMLLIVNRVASMIDAGWLAYKAGRGDYDGGGWSLDIEPGTMSSSLGISYRF